MQSLCVSELRGEAIIKINFKMYTWAKQTTSLLQNKGDVPETKHIGVLRLGVDTKFNGSWQNTLYWMCHKEPSLSILAFDKIIIAQWRAIRIT